MLDLSQLTSAVTDIETVEASAEALILKLMADVEANKADPIALQALVGRTKAASSKLAAAVATVPA